MKKTNSKKLLLTTEKLRELTTMNDEKLRQVVGGHSCAGTFFSTGPTHGG